MKIEELIDKLGERLLAMRKVPTDQGVIWAVDTNIAPKFCFSNKDLKIALNEAVAVTDNPFKNLFKGCRIQIVLNETYKPIQRVVSIEDDSIFFCNEEDYQKAISNNTWPGAIGFVKKTENIIILDD